MTNEETIKILHSEIEIFNSEINLSILNFMKRTCNQKIDVSLTTNVAASELLSKSISLIETMMTASNYDTYSTHCYSEMQTKVINLGHIVEDKLKQKRKDFADAIHNPR